MSRRRRKRADWLWEAGLIALCLAIFGAAYWMAVGRYEALITLP